MNNEDIILPMHGSRQSFSFSLPADAPLCWVASGIEFGLLWFLGRAVFSFEIQCKPDVELRTAAFTILPLVAGTGLKWSGVTSLQDLYAQRLYPEHLVRPWQPGNSSLFNMCPNITALQQTLGEVAYGLSDSSVDFFKRGAHSFGVQLSKTAAQWCLDIKLDHAELSEFFSPASSYETSETVAEILTSPRVNRKS